QETAPEGIPRVEQPALSGCAYWKHAAEGKTFHTEASDHYGCPIGSHTHGIDLPEDTAKELEGLVGTMVELQYIAMDEIPEIPRRETAFGVAVYAPLSQATFVPDAVLIRGNARQIMLLAEASHAAKIEIQGSVVGRPTCAAIPAVMKSGQSAANLGCIGNRVYTDMNDDEMYFVLSGDALEQVAEKLKIIVNANHELEKFHAGRS
ncbi:MAG: DUF169 domain-containing protein, partial [Planctomycetales bacterium]